MSEDEYEIIVVDDKSPFPIENVLCEILETHSNIRIIHHNENKRQGGAKNTGIRAAKGMYIAFADQDDQILGSGIVQALEMAISEKVDMLACRYRYEYDDGSRNELGWNVENGYSATGKDFCENHFDASVCVCPWEYLYRREFLVEQNRPYAENVLLEASDWVEWHLIHANKVAYCDALIYQWNVRDESTSHQTSSKHAAAWVLLGSRKIKDSQAIYSISPKYANMVYYDGWNNVNGTVRRLWKTTRYGDFFDELGIETLSALQQISFSKKVNIILRYPKLSIAGLYIIGSPIRLARDIRNVFKNGK